MKKSETVTFCVGIAAGLIIGLGISILVVMP